jgi:hypothetical protein
MNRIHEISIMKGNIQVQAARSTLGRAQWESQSFSVLAEMQRIESIPRAIAEEDLSDEYQLLKEKKRLLVGALEMEKASLELATKLAPLLVRFDR